MSTPAANPSPPPLRRACAWLAGAMLVVAGCAPAVPGAAAVEGPSGTEATTPAATQPGAATSTAPSATTTTVTVPPFSADGIEIRGTVQDLSRQVPQYSAVVSFPVVESDVVDQALVSQVNTLIETHVSERVESVVELLEALGPPRGSDDPSDYRFTYEVAYATVDLVCFRFFEESRLTGASDESQSVSTLMIDVRAGVELRLDDLLVGADGRVVVAGLARDLVVAQLYRGDAEQFAPFASGADPGAIEWVLLTDEGLAVSFDELSVGPAEMGTPTVVIPYSALEGVLDPSGAAAPFLS